MAAYTSKVSATPILDLQESPPKPPSSWKPRIIGGVIGACIAGLMILHDEHMLPELSSPGFNGLLLIPAWYLSVAIHELGHLIAGTLSNFPPAGLSIGPLTFMRSGKRWNFRFVRRCWLGGFFKPMVSDPDGPVRPFAAMVAGGPVASAAQTAVFFALWLSVGEGPWSAIATVFWIALFMVALNSIPFAVRSVNNDGRLLWRLWREPRQARSWRAILAVMSQETDGVLPRDWNGDWFRRALEFKTDAPEYAFTQLLATYRAMDQGDCNAAALYMENALRASGKSGAFRQILFLEAAWISAAVRHNSEQARTWLARAIQIRKLKTRDSIDGAIAICEQRYEDAIAHYQAAEASTDLRKLDSGLVRFARENWTKQINACREALEASRVA